MTQLRSFPLPIPPLKEQQLILEKLAALSKSCRIWKSQLSQAHKLSALLAAASVAAITGIHTEPEEHLKPPKTQLLAPVRLGASPSVKEQAPLAAILAHHNGSLPAKDLWQRYGGEIDGFYAQLKHEVGKGWLQEPEVAELTLVEAG
jgi:type I restriction enzyme S subunit